VRGLDDLDFAKAKEICIYDEPAACVERLQCLQEQLPSMYQCILEFNRRGRIPSVKYGINAALPTGHAKLCNVPAAVRPYNVPEN